MPEFTINEFKRILQQSSVISFSVFDTAICRRVRRPADRFYLLRYECLDKQALSELELERRLCVRNPEIFEAYRLALKDGKRAVFIEDTRLSPSDVQTILRGCGYDVEQGSIYVSSDIGLTKKSRKLFELVSSETGCPPQRMAHIGWNHYSDHVVPESIGIKTLLNKRIQETAPYFRPACKGDWGRLSAKGRFAESYIGSMMSLHAFRCGADSFWRKLGYECAGPMLASFTCWLMRMLRQDGIECAYFLSRDGQLLKMTYDALRECEEGLPPARYLYSSRRAWNLPAIKKLGDDELLFLCSGRGGVPAGMYLSRIGLDPAAFEPSIRRAGFRSPAEIVCGPGGREKLLRLFKEDAVAEAVLALAADQRRLLRSYLAQEGVFSHGRIGLVDVGWNCTSQYSLEAVLSDEHARPEVYGYYFGTFPTVLRLLENGMRCRGFICDAGRPEDMLRLATTFEELFELILSGDHGAVTGYIEENGIAKPVLDRLEHSPSQLRAIMEVRQGVMGFIEDCMSFGPGITDILDCEPCVGMAYIERLIMRPTWREASIIGEMEHSEDVGKGKKRKLASLPPLKAMLCDPHVMLNILNEAFWVPGLKKRLPFVIDVYERALPEVRACVRKLYRSIARPNKT